MRGSKGALGNSLQVVFGSVFTLVVGVVVTGLATRHYGPEGFGHLSYAIAWVSLFTIVGSLGTDSFLVWHLVEGKVDESAVLFTSFIVRSLSGFCLVLLAGSIGALFMPLGEGSWVLVLIISLSMWLRTAQVIDSWMQAHFRAGLSALVRSGVYLITAGAKATVVLGAGGIDLFAWAYVLDAGLYFIAIAIAFVGIRGKLGLLRLDWVFARDLLSQSRPLLISGFMVSAYQRVDQVMLGSLLPSKSQLGLYAAAVTLAEMWYFVPDAVILSLKPVIFAREKEDARLYAQSMSTLYGAVGALGIAAALVVSSASGVIVPLVYGSEFSAAASILSVLVWGGVFAMLNVCRSVWLVSQGLQRFAIVYTGASLSVNLLLNLLLIPSCGAMGSAIATVLSNVVSIVSLSFFSATRASTWMILNSMRPRVMVLSIRALLRGEV